MEAQSLADDGVADFVDGGWVFERRIFQKIASAEGLIYGDINVFVDGRCDDETPKAAVVRREVGASAADGDAQGCAGDDHSWE